MFVLQRSVIQKVERQSPQGENVFTNHLAGRRLVTRTYKACVQFNKKTTQFKNGRRTFSKEDRQMAEEVCAQSLIIISCERNANPNQDKNYFPPTRTTVTKKTDNNRCWRRCGEIRASCIATKIVKWCICFGEKSGSFFKGSTWSYHTTQHFYYYMYT